MERGVQQLMMTHVRFTRIQAATQTSDLVTCIPWLQSTVFAHGRELPTTNSSALMYQDLITAVKGIRYS